MQEISPLTGDAATTIRSMEQSLPTEKAEASAETKPFFTPPMYTMKEIHNAIPAHCFDRNTLLSLSYVLRDFFYVAILMGLATQIPLLPTHSLRVVAWTVYSFCQGLVFTGLWEIAHECGHGALSKSRWVNHAMGLVVHSSLLVPYHSWRFTHSQHHKSTNNIERDIAFVPDVSTYRTPSTNILEGTGADCLVRCRRRTCGWQPARPVRPKRFSRTGTWWRICRSSIY